MQNQQLVDRLKVARLLRFAAPIVPAPAPKKPAAAAPRATAHKIVTEVEAPTPTPVAAIVPEAGGDGVLMISSKPPCEIYVDGKATGLMTPQRAIPLLAGNHKITLVNASQKIKKTLAVAITADKPTKVIQDLMK